MNRFLLSIVVGVSFVNCEVVTLNDPRMEIMHDIAHGGKITKEEARRNVIEFCSSKINSLRSQLVEILASYNLTESDPQQLMDYTIRLALIREYEGIKKLLE